MNIHYEKSTTNLRQTKNQNKIASNQIDSEQNCCNMNLVHERVKQISINVMLHIVPRRKPQYVDT